MNSMKELKVEVITPARGKFSGTAVSVTIPGTMGGFQVLYNHAPIVSTFEIGKIKIETADGEKKIFATGGGTVEVLNNKVLLLAESFETPEEIDVKRAKEAMERAKGRLSKKSSEEKIDYARAEIALKRAINRLKITGNYN